MHPVYISAQRHRGFGKGSDLACSMSATMPLGTPMLVSMFDSSHALQQKV